MTKWVRFKYWLFYQLDITPASEYHDMLDAVIGVLEKMDKAWELQRKVNKDFSSHLKLYLEDRNKGYV